MQDLSDRQSAEVSVRRINENQIGQLSGRRLSDFEKYQKNVIKQLTKLGGYVKVNEVVRTTSTGKQVIRLTSARVSDPGS